jgi:uncharacterized protein
MKIVSKIAMILVVIGGLNWGLVGFFHFDLVAAIFGPMSILSKVVYILVGLSALFLATMIGKFPCECMSKQHSHTQGQ